MPINVAKLRERLQQFDFQRLFIEDLGWSQPATRQAVEMTVKGEVFTRRQISQLAGVAVFEITSNDGRIPDAKTRAAIHKEISALHHENLLIFLDHARAQSLWYWVKRQDAKNFPRDHFYVKGQPGDLFISKLGGIVFDFSELDEGGNVSVVEVANRLRHALDVEKVTKKFYREFYDEHIAFIELIHGIPDEKQRRWYASVLLNRLMFIYFLQRKGFVDNGDLNYLQNKLATVASGSDRRAEIVASGSDRRNRRSQTAATTDRFYRDFLCPLFFEGFAKPEDQRSPETRKLIGSIKYLNGGLFLPHKVEQDNPDIRVPDKAFENIFNLFQRYSWNLDDTPAGNDNEINPDVLGYIFEKYINQKAFGAYYTRTEITEYLCERTIHRLVLNAVNTSEVSKAHPIAGVKIRNYQTMPDLLMDLDAALCRELLFDVLPNLSLLDPACGSGAFLVAAMKTLINIYAAVVGKIKFLGQKNLTDWLEKTEREHKSLNYYIKKRIITNNLYGVDIMEEATEIARLRLFLALVASASDLDQLEPLPNIDFNILPGNSLVGLMRVNDQEFEKRNAQANLFHRSYAQVLAEKNRLIENYRHAANFTQTLTAMRDEIDKKKAEALITLNDILLAEFNRLGIKFEQAGWDEKKGEEKKSLKRNLKPKDIEVLQPFHWGFEFDKVLNERGGFDAIITNPPWEVFQTNEKEFFQRYAATIQKKKLRIEDWERQREGLMKDEELRKDWIEYASSFSHQWNLFKRSDQFRNQTSEIAGKSVGNKPNLYSLFAEQCFNLLRPSGMCGIVIPSGIYTDLGTKQLREMLFSNTQVTGLFCFENRKEIFEGVHRSFKFIVLTFEKGGTTNRIPAAFMRHDVAELEHFPLQGALDVSVDLIRRVSPVSLSIPEFKTDIDLRIANRLLAFPPLASSDHGWGIELYGEELNMTRSSKYFITKRTKYPLYEGNMIWHFESNFAEPRYWVSESDLRMEFLEKRAKRIGINERIPANLKNDYEVYRLAIRKIASNTNERTLIATIIPPNALAGNSLTVNFPFKNHPTAYNDLQHSLREVLSVVAVLNSFVLDYVLRSRMTTNLNLFYLYQLPVPRLTEADGAFKPIVERAARLICTTPEFDDLAKEVGLGSHQAGATAPAERARLRAELDGLVAHLYGLTEEEFAHILSTFPLVDASVKDAALAAFCSGGL